MVELKINLVIISSRRVLIRGLVSILFSRSRRDYSQFDSLWNDILSAFSVIGDPSGADRVGPSLTRTVCERCCFQFL